MLLTILRNSLSLDLHYNFCKYHITCSVLFSCHTFFQITVLYLNKITKCNSTDNNYLNVIEDRTSTIFTSSNKLFQQIISDKTLDMGINHNRVQVTLYLVNLKSLYTHFISIITYDIIWEILSCFWWHFIIIWNLEDVSYKVIKYKHGKNNLCEYFFSFKKWLIIS